MVSTVAQNKAMLVRLLSLFVEMLNSLTQTYEAIEKSAVTVEGVDDGVVFKNLTGEVVYKISVMPPAQMTDTRNSASDIYVRKSEAICACEKTADGYVFKNGNGEIVANIPAMIGEVV